MGQQLNSFQRPMPVRMQMVQQVRDLENQLSRQNEEIDRIKKESSVKDRRIENFKEQLEDNKLKITNLESKLMIEKTAKAEIEKIEIEKQRSKISKVIQSRRAEAKKQAQQLKELETELGSNKQEVIKMKEKTKNLEEHIEHLEEKLRKEKHSVSELQSQLDTERVNAQKKLNELQKDLKVKDTEKANLKEQLRKKEDSLTNLESWLDIISLEDLQEQVKKQSEQLNLKDTEKAKIEELLSEKEKTVTNLTIQLRGQQEQIQEKQKYIENVEKQLKEERERVFKLESESSANEHQHHFRKLGREDTEKEEKLFRAKNEHKSQEQKLTVSDTKIASLNKQLREEHRRVRNLQLELEAKKKELETTQEESTFSKQRLQGNDIVKVENQLKVTTQRCSRLNTDLEGKKKELEKMQNQIASLQEQLAGRNKEKKLLADQLRAERSENEQQLVQKQGESNNLEQQLQRKDTRIASLEKQISVEQQRNTDLQSQLTDLKGKGEREITDMLSYLNNLQKKSQLQTQEKDQQVGHLQSTLTNVQQQSQEKDQQIDDLKNQLSELQQQSGTKEQEIFELQRRVKSMKEQLEQNQNTFEIRRGWVINGNEIQVNPQEVLREGAWGKVFRGNFRRCKVAVTELCDKLVSTQERALFEREVCIASRCRHPCMLQFIGATNDVSPLMVAELMDCSLRSLCEERPLTEKEFSVISLDVAQALNYLHQIKPDPIIYREISSANVLLWRQGDQWRGKVSDYGTANVVRQCRVSDDPGAVIYCAPEASDREKNQIISCKMDVYSFGVLVCEMYIRELPDPQKRDEQVRRVTNKRLGSRLIRPCLRPRPGWRPDMEEVIDELEKQLKEATTVDRRPSCTYQETCRRFKSSLVLADAFFDEKHDMCYCTECHAARGDKLYYNRGEPPKNYGIPVGWCRFGLKVQPRAIALDVFDKWHVAFHGTRLGTVSAILECGDLLIPGDVALGGRELREEEGHFNDEWKPVGFDTKQIFVSPSVRYAGHDIYAEPSSFKDPTTKKRFVAKTVLQLCINPDSYKVGPQTIGATTDIDPRFSNEELEWSTKERGAIILYGLLVKLDNGT